MKRKILIYSAGDYAREVCFSAEAMFADDDLELKFIDDFATERELVGYDIITLEEAQKNFLDWQLVCAIGNPATRSEKIAEAANLGFSMISVIHPSAVIGPRITLGEGCIIQANVSMTCDIQLGDSVSLNLNCTVGHDVVIGNCVSVSPLTAISGRVIIEDNVRIGTGVSIINGTREKPLIIGKGAFIAAGATVTKAVPENSLVAGVPARLIKTFK